MLHPVPGHRMKHRKTAELNLELVARGEVKGPRRLHIDKQRALRAEGEGLVEDVIDIETEGPFLTVLIRGKQRRVPTGLEDDWARSYARWENIAPWSREVVVASLARTTTEAKALEASVSKIVASEKAIEVAVGVVDACASLINDRTLVARRNNLPVL